MSNDAKLYELLVCPQCLSGLILDDEGKVLACEKCKLSYPIIDGIPMLVTEDADLPEE